MQILVTGASRGLGLSAVERFRADGWTVTPFLRGDDINAIPQEIDVVLHCAGGGLGFREPLLPVEQLLELFFSNLGNAAEINRHVVPPMQARGHGTIIHVCSIASGEAVGSVGYNTVKAALAAYVRSLGRELAPSGVIVTGVSPGGFRAPDNAMERLKARSPDAYQCFVETRLPRRKMGEADEVIEVIRFLASSAASMMGGCVVPVDAGEGHYY